MQCGAASFRVVEACADEDAGYDRGHYDGCTRLTLVDPPETACDCEQCAAELARRPGLPN